MSKAPRKLDIMVLLNAIDQHDSDWLMAQPEDARKEFAPSVAMRWASNVSDSVEAAYMLWTINDRVNRHLFDLSQHPDLCYRLLASCGIKRSLHRQWLGPRRATDNLALSLLGEYHPSANETELRLLLSLYTRDTFADFLGDCGLDDEKSKKYLIAYDKLD